MVAKWNGHFWQPNHGEDMLECVVLGEQFV